MALKDMLKTITEARENYETAKKALGKDAQAVIAEAISSLLPEGYAVCWTQYAPYFNDGEACVFSVHDAWVVKLDPEKDRDEDTGLREDDAITSLGRYAVERIDEPDLKPDPNDSDWDRENAASFNAFRKATTKDRFSELVKIWDDLPEDMMEEAFGEHAEVIVRADGTFAVNECEHD